MVIKDAAMNFYVFSCIALLIKLFLFKAIFLFYFLALTSGLFLKFIVFGAVFLPAGDLFLAHTLSGNW